MELNFRLSPLLCTRCLQRELQAGRKQFDQPQRVLDGQSAVCVGQEPFPLGLVCQASLNTLSIQSRAALGLACTDLDGMAEKAILTVPGHIAAHSVRVTTRDG